MFLEMHRNFTFDIETERYSKVKKHSSNISSFINTSIDFYLRHLETKYMQDMMYMIGIPFFMFLVTTGLTLYFATMFFFVLTVLAGIYFIIFTYLFYYKYRGVKIAHNRK